MAANPDEVTMSFDERHAHTAPELPRSSRTVQLRAQIDDTRAEMSRTIDAIHERLRPRNLMTQARETVKRAATNRARNFARGAATIAGTLAGRSVQARATVARMTRENPGPAAALVGIAGGWLIVRVTRGRRRNHSR